MTIYDHDRIVSADKVEVKPVFEQRYKDLLGDRYEEFMTCSFNYLRKCIRVNTLKISVEDLHKRLVDQGWKLTPVPWCIEGFFVEGHNDQHRFDIGNLVEHNLGYFYVQEAASMIPPVVIRKELEAAENTEHFAVLDLCAAPGSKTSQIGQYMCNHGVLIANDADLGRLKPLTLNLQRMGITNALITNNAFQKSKRNGHLHNPTNQQFDVILVDAPCSGTGTIRKSFKTLEMYSTGLVHRMSATQKTLAKNAWQLLKPGGTMVYSTCTLEPQEDESVVSFLFDQFDDVELLPIELDIKRSEPILSDGKHEYNPEVKKCLRIYPQDNDSEGFFVAKLRKISQND